MHICLLGCLFISLVACSGSGGGASNSVVSDGATALLFSTEPGTTSSMAAVNPAIVVQLLDANGAVDTTATNVVTLAFATNPAEILIHQSGSDPAILEVVDLATIDHLGWFETQPDNEVGGMVFDPTSALLYYSIRTPGDFLSLDLIADLQTLVGTGGTLDNFKGLAFEVDGLKRLLGVTSSNTTLAVDDLHSIDIATGVSTVIGKIVPDVGTIKGFNGMATDPTDGTIYVVAKLNDAGLSGRALMSLDSTALTATLIGDTAEKIAGIAFDSSGVLYAVSGDGSTTPESLFRVDRSSALLTLVASLDIVQASSDGEAIAIVPARLLGTLSAAAVEGVATFSDVRIDAVASGYTLQASATGLTSATSTSFDITGIVGTAGIAELSEATQTIAEAVGAVTVSVVVDNPQLHDVVVTMEVSGTATDNGVDYDIDKSRFFNITIPAGDTTGAREFNVVDDTIIDVDETVIFNIVNVTLATTGVTVMQTITITDDE